MWGRSQKCSGETNPEHSPDAAWRTFLLAPAAASTKAPRIQVSHSQHLIQTLLCTPHVSLSSASSDCLSVCLFKSLWEVLPSVLGYLLPFPGKVLFILSELLSGHQEGMGAQCKPCAFIPNLHSIEEAALLLRWGIKWVILSFEVLHFFLYSYPDPPSS